MQYADYGRILDLTEQMWDMFVFRHALEGDLVWLWKEADGSDYPAEWTNGRYKWDGGVQITVNRFTEDLMKWSEDEGVLLQLNHRICYPEVDLETGNGNFPLRNSSMFRRDFLDRLSSIHAIDVSGFMRAYAYAQNGPGGEPYRRAKELYEQGYFRKGGLADCWRSPDLDAIARQHGLHSLFRRNGDVDQKLALRLIEALGADYREAIKVAIAWAERLRDEAIQRTCALAEERAEIASLFDLGEEPQADLRVGTLRFGTPDGDAYVPYLRSIHAELVRPNSLSHAMLTNCLIRALRFYTPRMLTIHYIDTREAGGALASVMADLVSAGLVPEGGPVTQPRTAAQVLADAAELMQNRLVNVLGSTFEDLWQYNHDAKMKQKHHLFLVQGFPEGFDAQATRNLMQLMSENGQRCGMTVFLAFDGGEAADRLLGSSLDDFLGLGVHSMDSHSEGAWFCPWAWDWVRFQLVPPESFDEVLAFLPSASSLVPTVSLEQVLASAPSLSSIDEIRAPIGMGEDSGTVDLVLDSSTHAHALVVGQVGSGKSTLLHTLIGSIAALYPPDEVIFYLLDFKQVEFRIYAPHEEGQGLPHAKIVSVNSDAEFGLSVLEGLEKEMQRRRESFPTSVVSLPEYRQKTREKMPRIVVVMDEFQRLFSGDAADADRARMLIDRVAREGRAFGIHLVLCSQTFRTHDLRDTTLAQIAVRIALRCDEEDARQLLDDDAPSVADLRAQGDAMLQDRGADKITSRRFIVAFEGPEARGASMTVLTSRYPPHSDRIVFDGDLAARPWGDGLLRPPVNRVPTANSPRFVDLVVGIPVAVESATCIRVRRDMGRNLALIGGDAAQATGIMLAALCSAAAQIPEQDLQIHVVNALRTDGALFAVVNGLASLPACRVHLKRQAADLFASLGDEVRRRGAEEASGATSPLILLAAFGMGSIVDLALGDPALDTVVRDGPELDVHMFSWWRSKTEFAAQVDRRLAAYFGVRILLRQTADDAGQLLPSGRQAQVVQRLKDNRAVLHDSDDPDKLCRFIPYAVDEDHSETAVAWLKVLSDEIVGSQ